MVLDSIEHECGAFLLADLLKHAPANRGDLPIFIDFGLNMAQQSLALEDF